MENRYPLFAGGRILKKEALWDLRDRSFDGWRLQYGDYTDGVIKGCRVRVEGQNLVIGTGILKYGDFICFQTEEAEVPFQAENRLVALKAVFASCQDSPDYTGHEWDFLLDEDLDLREGQIELCRFHLRTGSVLRHAYKDFRDMLTEYDTVNLAHATMSGRGKGKIHPEILLRFAAEMRERRQKDAADTAFCYGIWNAAGEVERDLVEAYLEDKGAELSENERTMEDVMSDMADILESGNIRARRGQGQRLIYVE